MQATINNELRLAVPMDVGSLSDLRRRAWTYLAAAGVATGMIDDVLIALHEAVANALTHSGAGSDVAVRVKVEATRSWSRSSTRAGASTPASPFLPDRPTSPPRAAEGSS